MLHLRKIKVSSLEVVDHAPGSGNENVQAVSKGAFLGAVGCPPVEDLGRKAERPREGSKLLVDLERAGVGGKKIIKFTHA